MSFLSLPTTKGLPFALGRLHPANLQKTWPLGRMLGFTRGGPPAMYLIRAKVHLCKGPWLDHGDKIHSSNRTRDRTGIGLWYPYMYNSVQPFMEDQNSPCRSKPMPNWNKTYTLSLFIAYNAFEPQNIQFVVSWFKHKYEIIWGSGVRERS